MIAIIMQAFKTDMFQQVEEIKESFLQKDWATVSAQAHKIKGTASNIGGLAFSDKASRIEQLIKSDDDIKANDLLDDLEQSYVELIQKIEETLP